MKIKILGLIIASLLSSTFFIACEKEKEKNTNTSPNTNIKPKASFIANNTSISKGDTVFFTDKSLNTPIDWTWNFGDGSFSAEQSPSHIYTKNGIFNVSLIVRNSTSSDTIIKNQFITVFLANDTTTVEFGANKTSVIEGETIQFLDLTTNQPTEWTWDFGDGSFSIEQHPSHIYTIPGTYTVKLIASNTHFINSITKTDYIIVNPAPLYFNNNQNILLENFIGHRCGNSPNATEEINSLISTYGSQVIPICIHFGYFSRPFPGYQTDYTSAVGDAIGNEFNVQITPSGMINRKGESDKLIDWAAWNTEINNLVSQSPKVGIIVEASTDINNTHLDVKLWIKAFESNNDLLKIQGFIIESQLLSEQIWYDNNPEYIEDYEHNYVLRGGINGISGTELSSTPINKDQIIEKNYSYNLDPLWVKENLSVIIIVYNSLSKEILQVEKQQL